MDKNDAVATVINEHLVLNKDTSIIEAIVDCKNELRKVVIVIVSDAAVDKFLTVIDDSFIPTGIIEEIRRNFEGLELLKLSGLSNTKSN